MPDERAQLASVATALDELTDRVTSLADDMHAAADEQAATELFEIERTLRQAARRLDRLVRAG